MKKPILNWETGRQDSSGQKPTYRKAKIFEFSFASLFNKKGGMDCYILDYDPDYALKPHNDPVEGLKHYRMNIVLKGSGQFICDKKIVNLFNRMVIFRPDIYEHSMRNGPVRRRVLSIGMAV